MIVPNLSAAAGGKSAGDPSESAPVTDSSSAVIDMGIEESTPPSEDVRAGLLDQHPTEQPDDPSLGGISPVFTREVQYWEPRIREWSKLYNLDPDIIATIMQIESCGDPGAASYAGAQGLFQVMPFHFDAGEDMLDPDTNALRGMAFYNRQLEYTGWDIYLSFAGYNGGYAASGSSYPYWANETQRYYTWAKGIYDDAKAGLSESPTLQQWLAAGGGSGCYRAAQRLGL
ncbi:MAG: lytic transglycosylase domain-containing protein [Chloroflexota bacterium]